MIDRISRNYVHYTAYRQQFTVWKGIHNNNEVRSSYDVANINGRAHYLGVTSQPRITLEASLKRAAEESTRIHEQYTSPSLGYVPPQSDIKGLPFRGQNIDLKA